MPIPMPIVGFDQTTGEPMAPQVVPPQPIEPNTWDWKSTIEGGGAPVPSQMPFIGGPGQAVVGQNKYTGMRVGPAWTPQDWAAYEQRRVAEDQARQDALDRQAQESQMWRMGRLSAGVEKAVEQAYKFRQGQAFGAAIAGGMPMPEALTRFSGMWIGTPNAGPAMRLLSEAENAKTPLPEWMTRVEGKPVVRKDWDPNLAGAEKATKLAEEYAAKARAGDPNAADEYNRQMEIAAVYKRKFAPSPGSSVSITSTPGGGTVAEVKQGVYDQPEVLTPTNKTGVQAQTMAAESAYYLAKQLQDTLRAANVGVSGTVGDFADRWMEQAASVIGYNKKPDEKRIEWRTFSKALTEQMLRLLSNSPERVLSDKDRKSITDIVDTMDISKGQGFVYTKLNAIQKLLQDKVKFFSKEQGQIPPAWAMNRTDMQKVVQKHKDELEAKLKAGHITPKKAEQSLTGLVESLTKHLESQKSK